MDEPRILDGINSPADLKTLAAAQLDLLAAEIRERILETVARTGGHLSANLGVVELTIALHRVYDSPTDKIIWDVGHQCYAHKLLTGRRKRFASLRQEGGIAGFPRRSESPHDAFGAGHASTAISAALGFAKARDLRGGSERIVAVVGDGAMTGGLALEGLNNAGELKTDITMVLNDNEMSIAENVGALAVHLSKLRMHPLYRRMETRAKTMIDRLPVGSKTTARTAEGIYHGITHLMATKSGVIFEELGFTYLGPIDGHDISLLMEVFEHSKSIAGPALIHVVTTKGKGYEHAENNSRVFHGISGFDVTDGVIEKATGNASYTRAFSETLVELAAEDPTILAITAAMPDGTGLGRFAEAYPERYFDVGIAEPHAVTFAAGLAAAGFRPVVAVYSSFLQRAYDQIVHDVCLQKLPVVFAIDRAGIVGDDGPTHHGVFDLSFLRHIPELVVMAPKDADELRDMLATALKHDGPVAIRYPRGGSPTPWTRSEPEILTIGRAEVLRRGSDVAIVALGSAVHPAVQAAAALAQEDIDVEVINARFAKPLDDEPILQAAARCRSMVVVEENTIVGGFGSAVLELLADVKLQGVTVERVGLPDRFIECGSPDSVRQALGLDATHIAETAKALLIAGEAAVRQL
ncbi:MAG: 1-deoxy-D-xylulose-5-phosphate synthase [Armatimonadota bacterium]|nr:1-deoxy-D-xylulose-5-phosphate synthase [Armatimonadota bacterium]